MSQPDDYDFWSPGVWGPIERPMLNAIGDLRRRLGTSDPGLAQARGAAAATGRLRAQMEPFQSGYSTPAGLDLPRPAGLRRAPRGARGDAGRRPAAALRGDRGGRRLRHPLRPGRPACPENLQITCDSLLAFQRDLEARGLADRVLVHVWSEFGRRPEENGSGTDHGAGGCSFVIGTQARGEMVGEFPGLTALDADDNLRSTSDFRGLYRGLLEQWFGVDAAPIIPGAVRASRRRRCSRLTPAGLGGCARRLHKPPLVGHGPARAAGPYRRAAWRFCSGFLGVLGFSFSLPATRLAVEELDATFVGLGRAVVAAALARALLAAAPAPAAARPARGGWRSWRSGW